jgi:hypothetical protein
MAVAGSPGPYSPTLPWGYMEALTAVMGRQIQQLIGVPMTRVAVDFAPADTTLLVESTLGFPSSGRIWVAKRIFFYTGITSTSFTGVTTPADRVYTIGVKTEVTPDLSSVAPA